MSKAHDPHWRYIALRLEGPRPVGRRSLQNALLGRARREGVPDDEAPQLTRYAWPHAIVKVHHHALAAARAWLPRIEFAVEGPEKVPIRVQPISSSGTIKTLTARLGVLAERAPGAGPGRPGTAMRRGAAARGAAGPRGTGGGRRGDRGAGSASQSHGPAAPVRAPGHGERG